MAPSLAESLDLPLWLDTQCIFQSQLLTEMSVLCYRLAHNKINKLYFCILFSETLIRNQRRSARSGQLHFLGTYLSDNQVLIWKFNRLDSNRDKLLVSNEFLTPTMKKILGNIKRGRKCGKKLLNDCDLDKDRGLSMMEWTHCLRTSSGRMPLQ